ncbi:phosphate ABC transporter permease subunit PstC [Aestuariivirga sp.]|uniref:phosphate ABC transporter permease subunit PstC n=1 Tax=Aestuariivirga sp. TaxID=2650926 RepID=UPI00391CC0B8
MTAIYFLLLAALVASAFFLARARAAGIAHPSELHSLPAYHGLFAAASVLLPMLAVIVIGLPLAERYAVWAGLSPFEPAALADPLQRGSLLRDVENLMRGQYAGTPSAELSAAAAAMAEAQSLSAWAVLLLGAGAGFAGLWFALARVRPDFRARNGFERITAIVLLACSAVAVLTTIGIIFSVLFETLRFFSKVPVSEFLFGLHWSPQTAIRADQGGSSGAFGILPLLAGTFLITAIAMLVAGPIGLFAAIYMAEYASDRMRAFAKPVLEILAGIPTVVLGFFAALTVAPLIRGWGESIGLSVASESALAAGLVMGMMIIPFVSSLSDDVINAVPQSLRDGSYAMGATRSETIRKVVLPAALPGIVSAFMLAISRAVGETMIVVMAAGLAANLTFNPLEAVTTITVQIKTILVGDQEFDSAKTLSAFALGFVLFFFTLILNFIALRVVQRYREQYD